MKLAIIGLVIASFLSNLALYHLRKRRLMKPLPQEMKDEFGDFPHAKSISYNLDMMLVDYRFLSISFLTILVIMLCNLVILVSESLSLLFDDVLLNDVMTVLIISLPFFVYDFVKNYITTFGIEEKYEFNKKTTRTFSVDMVIRYSVVLLVLLWIVCLLNALVDAKHWIITIIMGISLLLLVIIRNKVIFNFKPLKNSVLVEKLRDFASSNRVKIKNIFVNNMSIRSNKANAFVDARGRSKKIVLDDTLLSVLSEDEIIAVFAHEIGHIKKRHPFVICVLHSVWITACIYIFVRIIQSAEILKASGVSQINPPLVLFLAFALCPSIKLIVGIMLNPLSRRLEYSADSFSVKTTSKAGMIGALKRLSEHNLFNLNPHPVDIFISHAHPSIYQRISSIARFNL